MPAEKSLSQSTPSQQQPVARADSPSAPKRPQPGSIEFVDRPKPTKKRLRIDQMKLAEHGMRVFTAKVASDTTLEDIMRPEFYANVTGYGGGLRYADRITVEVEDRSWIYDLIVKNAGKAYAEMHLAAAHEMNASPPASMPVPEGYSIKWRGDIAQWSVMRENDHAVLRETFATEQIASNWLYEYVKSQRPAA